MADNDERRLLKKKTTSTLRTPWLSNVSKSIGGIVKDSISEMIPNMTAVQNETKKEFENISRLATSTNKKSTFQDMLNKNPYVSLAKTAMKNIASDIKTGNLNNKQREDEVMEALFGGASMSDFDADFSDEDFDFDSDMFGDFDSDDDFADEAPKAKDVTGIHIKKQTKELQDTTREAAIAIYGGIQKSTKVQAEGSKALIHSVLGATSTLATQQAEIGSSIIKSLTSQEASLASIVEFNNTVMREFITKATAFMEKRGGEDNSGVDSYASDLDSKTKKNPFEMFNENGVIRLDVYKDYVKKGFGENVIKNTGSVGMILSMLDPNSDMMKAMIANPIGMMSGMLIKSVIPEAVEKTVESVDRTIGSFFPALFMKLGQRADNISNPILKTIAKSLGFDPGRFRVQSEIDLGKSRLQGNAAIFDDVTKNSINNIIPKELFTQTSLLKHIADKMGVNTRRANEQAEVFDINTNRYIQRKDVNDNIANTIVEAVSNAWNSTDIAEALNEVIGNFKSESDQRMMGNIIREFKYLSSANPSFIDPTGNFNNKRLDNILKQIHAPKEMVDVLDKSLKNAVSQQRAMGLYQAVLSGSNAINETIDQISNNPVDYNLFVSDFVKNKNVGAVLNDYFKTKQDVGDTYFQIDARESNLKDLEEKYKDKGNFKLRVEELRNRIRNQSSASGISMTEQEEEQEIIRLLREDRKESVGYKSNISSSEKDRLATIQSGRVATGEGKESGSGRIFGKNGLIRNMGQSANNLMYSIIFGNTNDVKAQVKEIGSQISSAIGEGITENAIKPVMKALFGSKKQILGPNGEVLASKREDGLFSGMMNKASDILHKVKYQIDGKEYHDSSGKLHEAKGDDYSLLGSAKSLVRNIYKDTASTVKSVLFGKDKVDENGEVVYQEQEVKDPKTGKITKKKVAVKDSRGIIGSTLKYVQDTFINRTDGWASNFFGTRTDENGNEVKRSFKMWLEDSVGKISDDDVSRAVKGGIIGGATFGAMGGSLLGNLVGGPFVGAALGSAVGFASKSEKFQNWLFGEEYTDSEGNKQRAGGLISQKMQNLLKNNKKSAVAGATLGALGGSALLNLLPGNFGLLGNLVGGPVGGAAIGLAATLFTKSDMFHEFLFGKKNEKGEILQSGVIDWWKQAWNSVKLFGEDEDEVKKAQQAAGFRAVGGAGGFLAGSILAKMGFLPAFLGPAGPIGGAMLGLAASIAHERGGIKKWLFGTKNPDDLPWVKVGILGQLKNMMEVNVVRPMVDNASIVMQNVAHVVKYEVLDPVRQAVYPLVRLSKRVLKTGARLVNSMAKRTFDLLDKNGAFHKVFGAIASIAEKMGENFVDKTVNGVLFPFRVFGKIASGVGGLASLIDAKISKDPKAYTDWKRERAERANEKRENKLRIQNAKRELKERQKNRKLIAKWTKNGAWEDTDENRAEANLQYRRKTGRDLKFYGEEGYDNSLERKRENQIARMSDDDVLKSDSNDPAIRSLRQQILMTRNLDDIKNILTNISSRFGGRTPFSDTTAKNIFDGFSEDKQLQGLSPRDALKYLKNKLKNLPDDATEEERNQINEAIEKARELIKKEKEKKKAEKEQKKEEEEKAKGQRKEDKEEQKRVLNEQKAKNKRYNDYVKTLNAELKKPLSRRDYSKIYQFVSAIKREKPDAKPLSPEDEIRLQEWMKKNGKQDYDLKDLTGDDFITRGLDKLFKRLFPGKNPGYATGTDSATPGFHEVGERGPETIVDRFGSLSRIGKHFTRFFEGGEQVYAKGEPIPVTIKSVLESGRNFLYDSLSDIQYRLFKDKSNEELKKQTSVLESIQGKVSDLSSRSSIDNDIGDDFDGEDEFKEKKTASIAQVGSIYADDGEEKEDIEGTYENQMADKLEESREKKREGFFKTIISHLKGIKEDQKEHGFQWSSIFSKKGLITGGLLLLLPFLIKKLPIFGKILGGIFDLLGNVGGALVNFIGGIVKDKQWADENRTNTNGETAEEARKDNEKDMEALENFDVGRFILGEDGEWDHQSKGRSVFATNMVRATANIGKTKVAQKIGKGVSKLNDFESKIRDALSQKSLGTRVGEKVSKAKVVGGKALSSGKNLFNSVKGSASATLSSVKSTITNPNLTISGKIGELSSKATSKISSKIDALATKKAVGEAQETVAEKIIYKTISTLEDGIGSMVSKVASKIGGKGSSGGVKNALKGVFNWIKKKATIPKILGYLGNIFNIKSVVKIVTAPIRAVFADPFAAIIGAVDGATGAAKLFQVDKDNVDVKMIAISSVIGAIAYTTIGSILMLFNDLFADEQGVSLVTHIANTIYDLVSNKEDEKILDSAQDSFKDSYLDYQENEVKKSFETYKKIHKDSDMTFEQYQALVDSGELSATYDSFADYNNDKNASIMDKAGKAVGEFFSGVGDKASDFFGKTKVTFKEDTKNNVYYKKESTDDKWIAYDATTGEEIGEVAESTIKEFSTKTYTKTIGWKTASDYAKESSFEELLEKEAQGNIVYYSKNNSTFFFLTGKGTFTEVNGNGRITTSALTTSEFYQEYLYNGKITKYTIDEDTKEKNVPKAVQEIFSDLHYDGTGDDSSVKRISKLYSANTTAEVDLIENSAIGNICYVDETGYIYYIYAGKEKFIKYDSKQGKILDRNVTSKDVNKMLNERTLKKHGLSSDKDQELIEIFKENNSSEELLSNEVNNKSSLYQSLRDALTLNATRDKDRVSGSTSTHNLGKTSSRSSSSRSSLRLNASSNSNTK